MSALYQLGFHHAGGKAQCTQGRVELYSYLGDEKLAAMFKELKVFRVEWQVRFML